MGWLDKMIESNYEGLILKDIDSEYIPGEMGRKTKKWIKIKPDYVDGLGDGIDLVIIGGYYGEGNRRSGDVSHFLLGVSDNNYLPLNSRKYYTFGKVGSGYTLQELSSIRQKLSSHFISDKY